MSTHADEESDEGVVPMKRPNNEGSPSAETVEGRTSPKGNGGETAAVRTQRREAASNGLVAVRQAARQSKSVRFTALLHHITVDLLKQSYLSLERDSAPGIDGVMWQAYGEGLHCILAPKTQTKGRQSREHVIYGYAPNLEFECDLKQICAEEEAGVSLGSTFPRCAGLRSLAPPTKGENLVRAGLAATDRARHKGRWSELPAP